MALKMTLILGVAAAWLATGALGQSLPLHMDQPGEPTVDKGPYLFLDDALIAETSGLTFTLHAPEKHEGNPTLLGDNPYTDLDKATAPFSVEYDDDIGTFRMWYTPHSRSGLGYHMGIGTSADGIQWDYPDLGAVDFHGSTHNNLVVEHVIGGAVIVDPRPGHDSERYKAVFYRHDPHPRGFSVASSPDGVRWSPPEFIEELDDSEGKTGTGASDIVNLLYDPKREEFVALFKMWSLPGEYTVPVKRGVPAPACGRRIVGMSRSKDFKTWSKARVIVRADDEDPPTLEFYGISSVVQRGGLFLGFIPCLIDDTPPDGIGWTELIVSRDADCWQRIRQPFLQRSENDDKAPDHAIAWISEVVSVGEREFVYYTALEYGHKTGGRSGCLAFLRKDGFVSADAGADPGRLLTKALRVPSESTGLSINADASVGAVRVQLLANGKPLEGYSFDDCDPIAADAVSIPVQWGEKADLPKRGAPIQIEFRVRDAKLYAFSFMH
jgi:hypothetical protein